MFGGDEDVVKMPHDLLEDIEEEIVSKKKITYIVKRLAREISGDYACKDLIIVAILKGAFIFVSDLVRSLSIPACVDFMAMSGFGQTSGGAGEAKIIKDLDESIQGRHVILVQGIVDTGFSLNYIIRNLNARIPASIKVCALLNKPARRIINLSPDYCGIDIPDKFVVGYGLDYMGFYRNLPFIGVLKEEVFSRGDRFVKP